MFYLKFFKKPSNKTCSKNQKKKKKIVIQFCKQKKDYF